MDELRRAAHTLKSNGETFGAGDFAALCRELEERPGAVSWTDATELVERIEREYVRLQEALAALRTRSTLVTPPAGGRVLVVDDSAVNRMVLTKALSADGHTSMTAEHGLQALELLQAGAEPDVDVVLLDLEMPELDGYETLARIKNDDRLRHLPVIVISSVDELDSVVRCIEIGATDYLPKPFDAEVLRARLNSSLAEKRLHDLQLEYLEQVGCVVDAAAAVEAETSNLRASTASPRGTMHSASLRACSSAWRARCSSANAV